MNNTYHILVVDDEEDLCEILQFNLEKEGYSVDVAYSSEEALKQDFRQYDLFLLDVMMGEISGFKLGSDIKRNEATSHIPIIFLTAKDTETDTLTGFNLGADDYIAKPYSVKEVLARVKAVLKRSSNKRVEGMPPNERFLKHEDLCLNLTSKKAFLGKEEIPLTKKEFEILCLLMDKPNKVFSREVILLNIWNETNVTDRTIDVNITRLRKKIEPYGKKIVTRLGYGYCFETQK